MERRRIDVDIENTDEFENPAVQDRILNAAWTGLTHAVRTDEPSFEVVHGLPFFDYVQAHPDKGQLFDAAITSVAAIGIGPLAAAGDFGRFRSVVDVGGGLGSTLAQVLRANANLHGVLYDLPTVVAAAGGDFNGIDLVAQVVAVEGGLLRVGDRRGLTVVVVAERGGLLGAALLHLIEAGVADRVGVDLRARRGVVDVRKIAVESCSS